MTLITRRNALAAGLATSAAACAGSPKYTHYQSVTQGSEGVFAHGVASGDPAADSLVIWTRVSIERGAAQVLWEVAADEAFTTIRAQGEALAAQASDWTVKVVVEGLNPGEKLFYRFRLGDAVSPIGRTRTLPAGEISSARFAVVSCSNYQFGFFNVYDLIARQEDLDAVIHLGDYIYEYGATGYGGKAAKALDRVHEPDKEIITLDDYRKRHAQYKADPASQAMHAAHPLIPTWDDHETSNNSWQGGAQNHQRKKEGSWDARRRAALQAYYEWMPVRDPAPGLGREALFRSYSYGGLLTLAALETRLMARSKQFDYDKLTPTLKTPEDIAHFRDQVLWDASREMLGATQLDYMDRTISESAAQNQPWRLIANQIIMAHIIAPDLSIYVEEEDIAELEKDWKQARAFIEFSKLGLPINLDSWDGYPAARERLYDAAKAANAQDLLVLTGDTHTWWANDLFAKDGAHMGVELGVNSVTSPSPYHSDFLGGRGDDYALLTNRKNEAVRYLSGNDHGYIDLTVTPQKAKARFMAVDTITETDYNAFEKVAFEISKKSDGGIKFTDTDGLGFKQRVLF